MLGVTMAERKQRIDSASDKRPKPTAPQWRNPRDTEPEISTTVLDRAFAIYPTTIDPRIDKNLLAAIIFAQAVERFGEQLIAAASISSRPRS